MKQKTAEHAEERLELETEIRKLEKMIGDLDRDVKDQKREGERTEKDLRSVVEHLKISKMEEGKRLKEEMEKMALDFEKKQAEMESKRAESRSVNEKLNEQLRHAINNNDELNSTLSGLRQDKFKSDEERRFADQQCKQLAEEKLQIEMDAKNAMDSLEATFKEKLNILQQDMSTLKYEIQNRDTSIHDIVSENERLKVQNMELEETVRVTMMVMKMMKGAIES